MSTLTMLWIFVGFVLWGLPTGVLVAFMLANLTIDAGIQFVGLQEEKFKLYLMISVPVFCALGLWFGIYMGHKTKKYEKDY